MFLIEYSQIKCNYGRIEYITNEYSFMSYPALNSLPAILVQNLNITFDYESKTANDIWGYHSYTKWIHTELEPPKAKPGKLYLSDEIGCQDCYRIEETSQWNTFYDSISGWICIGDQFVSGYTIPFNSNNGAIEFYPNVVAVIGDSNLISLWIKPFFIGDIIS